MSRRDEFKLSKISDIYMIVNDATIPVGVCLGTNVYTKEKITNTEYEERRKKFELGDQHINDLVFHYAGKFIDNVAERPIAQKWIDELTKQGYDISSLQYEIAE